MYFGATAPGRNFWKRTRGVSATCPTLRRHGAEVVDDIGRLAQGLAAREADLAGGAVDADDLDEHLVAFLADVLHGAHPLLVELADVHEPVRAREDLDEGAELGQPLDD